MNARENEGNIKHGDSKQKERNKQRKIRKGETILEKEQPGIFNRGTETKKEINKRKEGRNTSFIKFYRLIKKKETKGV